MTDAERETFVAEQKSLQVGTLNRDGSVHLTTLWYALVDGRIAFETYQKSQKIRNLERDPRVAVLVETGDSYGELRGVSINGTAELDADPAAVTGVAREVMKKYQPGLEGDALEGAAKQLAAKRTAVFIKPDKIMSWDHRKLSGGY